MTGQQSRKPIQRKMYLKKKQRDNSLENSVINLLDNVVSTAQQQQTLQTQSEDEFYFFALSVAAQLRKLPLHIALDAQRNIQNMLSTTRLSLIHSNQKTGLQ